MITGAIELYNLRTDLGETNNVAKEHPDIVAQVDTIMKREHQPSPHWKPPSAKRKRTSK
jgi:uncharacterized sulfatase